MTTEERIRHETDRLLDRAIALGHFKLELFDTIHTLARNRITGEPIDWETLAANRELFRERLEEATAIGEMKRKARKEKNAAKQLNLFEEDP